MIHRFKIILTSGTVITFSQDSALKAKKCSKLLIKGMQEQSENTMAFDCVEGMVALLPSEIAAFTITVEVE